MTELFQEAEMQLLWLNANYPYSFFGFGYPRKEGSYKSWLLRDPESGDFGIFATNRWSHMCLSYRAEDGFIKVAKVIKHCPKGPRHY